MGMALRGEPVAYGEGDGVAYQIALTREKLEAIRRAWNLPSPSYIYLRPEDLGDLSPLERAAQMALEDPAQAQLLPRHENGLVRKRQETHHYDRYASARRMKVIPRLHSNPPPVNHTEEFSHKHSP